MMIWDEFESTSAATDKLEAWKMRTLASCLGVSISPELYMEVSGFFWGLAVNYVSMNQH